NTRLIDGSSNWCAPKPSSRLFSSGTQSKHHAKLGTERSRSQTSFIHCPPHGPGSKKGSTRKGRVTACRSPRRKASPLISFGSSLSFESRRKSQRRSSGFFHRSQTRQSM